MKNKRNLENLKKLQAYIKGLIVRKKVNNMNVYGSTFTSTKSNLLSLSLNKYTQIETNLITQEDIQKLFEEYPPLSNLTKLKLSHPPKTPLKNDNKKVVLKPPVEYENHAVYYGEWSKTDPPTRYGRGIQIWSDGSRYEGYWKNNRANIQGKLIHSNGDIYLGEWSNDNAEGYGVYTHTDGAQYKGYWKQDKQNGKGLESWPEGTFYEGNYLNGKKCGKGKFKWSDGSSYEGEFKNNNIDGIGTYTWTDQRKYHGQWKENRMEGKGEFTYPDGRKYEGYYKNDKMNGKGVFTWPNGRKYEGEYKDDKKEGYGSFQWADGRIYKGYWKNGKQDGEGEFYNIKNKTWRKGIWEEGKRIRWLDEEGTISRKESKKSSENKE